MVSSFLDYARPGQAGDVPPIDVNATVRRTMQLLDPQFGDGVESETDEGADVPRARIDAERLRQVIINLALNAVQAMEGQGRLTVRTRSLDRRGERWVEVHVVDTGPGIPQTVLKNLFVPFVTTKERGTGLGLAISQRIVTAAGGHIEVRSSAGVGTTFVVRLPSADVALDDPARPGASERPSAPLPDEPRAEVAPGAGESRAAAGR